VPDPPTPASGRFLGVRLSSEEDRRLEELVVERKLESRSDAVRALLREAPVERPALVELPATRRAELEQLVEDGYFSTVASAVEYALEAGLRDLVTNHRDGLAELGRRARELRERGARRRRADREGRELLRR
jgi:Arc/MetJ-type ribon-helix-helix transcriptional regulator